MKKIILIIAFFTFCLSFSQELKPLKIYHKKDDMTKRDYYYSSRRLVYADTITKSGEVEIVAFGANLSFYVKKDKPVISGFQIICNSIGCIDKCKVLILFENEETIELNSFNDFNCNGNAYFGLSKNNYEKLALYKVKKIRITNGLNYKSVTGVIDEPDYFIKTIQLLNKNEITEKE